MFMCTQRRASLPNGHQLAPPPPSSTPRSYAFAQAHAQKLASFDVSLRSSLPLPPPAASSAAARTKRDFFAEGHRIAQTDPALKVIDHGSRTFCEADGARPRRWAYACA